MVLDDASASPAAESFDSAPASDNDRYATTLASDSEMNIDTSTFNPAPIFGALGGFNEGVLKRLVKVKLHSYQELVQRPLTPEEIQAVSVNMGKQLTTASYGTPAGLLAGAYRAYSTTDQFKFPLYKPNLETFNREIFLTPKIAILRGPQALLAWTCVRYLSYMYIGKVLSKLLFFVAAANAAGQSERNDPRMRDIVVAAREKVQQRIAARASGAPVPPIFPRQNVPVQPQDTPQDDASPTGGMSYEAQMNSAETFQTKDSPETPGAPATNTPPPMRTRPWPVVRPQVPKDEKPFDMFEDDMSPTSGQGMNQETYKTTSTSSSGGSAWDKIRRGERPAPQAPQAPTKQQSGWGRRQNKTQSEQREGSTTGDSFTFSKTEEERSLAQVEAQKDFDARIEKERRGGDFNSAGGKNW